MSSMDILTPLSISGHDTPSQHWSRDTTTPVGASSASDVQRTTFEEMPAGAANSSWVADCNNMDHTWAVFKARIIKPINCFVLLHCAAMLVVPRDPKKGPKGQLRRRNRAWRLHHLTGEGHDSYREIRNLCTALKLTKGKACEEHVHLRRTVRLRPGVPADRKRIHG